MARPREFDMDEAVSAAMNAFWEKGYEGTSLHDLLDAMEITRGSLYKAFGSKKELFLRALNAYDEIYVSPGEARLKSEDVPGKERISAVFQGARATLEKGENRGCLLCNTAAGAPINDKDIAARVDDQIERLRSGFRKALEDDGAKSNAAKWEADRLTREYVGLRVLSRGKAI
ncbi:TetR/AcrR family transcriptional regulator [Ahrensia sp. R2A130]|uniref:TetR/AcrR family transcriptional regulator n=1 Tax=Ahrensia sp. R2A130 TaxID=744979 RepID=UPI0001E0F841|nr:TetR/AcrR family transcriptional regulator [Ahrensia sp. R2A130]EFL90489.1 TetR family transcriptional regulator [Ahrensia sp. R2A130]